MILHVANLDKFIPPFIAFVNENFDAKRHSFLVLGNNKKHPVLEQKNLRICRPTLAGLLKYYGRLFKDAQCAEKIILHGLFDIRLVILLSMMPWVLKKCYWVIWGGDLYSYKTPKPRKRDKIKEAFRAFVIKRLGYLVSYIPGDVELARKWYKVKGKHKECLMYLSNIVDDKFIEKVSQLNKLTSKTINIVVGNSADPSNNHIEILKKLTVYKKHDIRLIVPLSYGDNKHAGKVISYGYQEFGDKFEPLNDFMPLDDYLQILYSADIAIFNHERQQAMGNTISLLGMGKTVYMREGVSQLEFLESLGIELRKLDDFDLSCLPVESKKNNQKIVREYFSKRQLLRHWNTIFEG